MIARYSLQCRNINHTSYQYYRNSPNDSLKFPWLHQGNFDDRPFALLVDISFTWRTTMGLHFEFWEEACSECFKWSSFWMRVSGGPNRSWLWLRADAPLMPCAKPLWHLNQIQINNCSQHAQPMYCHWIFSRQMVLKLLPSRPAWTGNIQGKANSHCLFPGIPKSNYHY